MTVCHDVLFNIPQFLSLGSYSRFCSGRNLSHTLDEVMPVMRPAAAPGGKRPAPLSVGGPGSTPGAGPRANAPIMAKAMGLAAADGGHHHGALVT